MTLFAFWSWVLLLDLVVYGGLFLFVTRVLT